MTSFLGANWRTSTAGLAETLCIIIIAICSLPADIWTNPRVWVPAVGLIVAKTIKDFVTKDKAVTGGTVKNDPPAVPPSVLAAAPGPLTLIMVSAIALGLTACAWTKAHETQIVSTADYALQKTEQVAVSTVLSAAVSAADGQAKGNYLDGLAAGFRTQEGSLLTSDDVKSLTAIWTPSAPHWAELGTQLATLYANANPRTPAEASALLESIAKGLNQVAAK